MSMVRGRDSVPQIQISAGSHQRLEGLKHVFPVFEVNTLEELFE
jgi:hypothetical protein